MKRVLSEAVLHEVGFLLLLGCFLLSNAIPAFAAGNWLPTPLMYAARDSHTATLLSDGKVLVTGGIGGGDSAEIYDPDANTWTPVTSMNVGRDRHTATLLENGKVLVTGGDYTGGSSTEIFDPTVGGGLGAWTTASPMNVGRYGHTATLLSDGKVLVTGGYSDTNNRFELSAEIFDPAGNGGLGTWTLVASMNVERRDHTATLLKDGRVLVTGGYTGSSYEKSAEIYHPGTNTWTGLNDMNQNRSFHTATLLNDGRVLVTGGFERDLSNGTNFFHRTTEIYDPSDNTLGSWSTVSQMGRQRSGHTATLLSDGSGRVLVTGGYNGSTERSAEIYDPSATVSGTWTYAYEMGAARDTHTATLLSDGRVLVAGGYNGYSRNGTAEIYDPDATAWTITYSMGGGNTLRAYHTATPLKDGRVLVTGGYNGTINIRYTEIYDPVAGSWTGAYSMNVARSGHTATLLNDGSGRVLVTGGVNAINGYESSAEIYDPASGGGLGAWTTVSPMNVGRYRHTATLLNDGRVLVTGGVGESSAEIYDPVGGGGLGAWTTTVSSMNVARAGHTATLLSNGRVLVAGSGSAQIFDPTSNDWTPASPSPMVAPRSSHTATLLSDGRVLVTGGCCSSLFRAELFDPSEGTWTPTYSTINPRDSHTATLLDDGRVLVTGGYNFLYSYTMSGVEIYSGGVINVAPMADAGGPYDVNEGGTVTLNGTGTDGDEDPLDYSWDLNDDGTFETPGQNPTFSAETLGGPDSRTVVLQVCDDNGACSTDSATVNINNVPPTASAGGPYSVDEGGSVALAGTGSDFSGDLFTFNWDLDNDGTFETPGQGPTFSAAALDGPADQTVAVEVCDDDGGCSTAITTVTINNVAPTVAVDNSSVTVNAGQTANNTGTFADVAADTVTISVSAAVGTVTQSGTNSGTWSWSFPTSGIGDSQTVTITATDDDGGSSTTTFDLTVNEINPPNTPPTVEVVNSSVTVDEGQTANNTGTYFDGDADNVTIEASVGTVTKTGANTWSWSLGTTDGPDQSQTVTVTATDPGGASSTTAFDLTVNNVAPLVGSIAGPLDPVPVSTSITATASFMDPGTADTHTAQWNWGDGNSTTETNASGSVSDSHIYSAPGIYAVSLTVTDDDGGSGTSVFQYVVVYDPSGSFVTGGGWIMSPPGAYVADPSLTGKANFGFVSKYKKGANVPTGNTEFQFHAADFNFHSSTYEWLVVAGPQAQFKGTGTINGAGSYGYMLTAIDGQVDGGGGLDKFRIKIWDVNSGMVVYDNKIGQPDDAEPTVIGGGSIVIHTGGKHN